MRIDRFALAGILCIASCVASGDDPAVNAPLTDQARAAALANDQVDTHVSASCPGVVVQTPRPGDALTLEALGLPASAAGSSLGALYAEASRRGATWLDTMACAPTGRRHELRPSPRIAHDVDPSSTIFSGNWSGYQGTEAGQYIQIGWTVPTVTVPSPGYSSIGYFSSIWSGLGGGFNAGLPLIQAGTEQDLSATGVASYYAWYEVVGGEGDTGSEVKIKNLAISPGDVVGSVALWTAGTSAEMGVCNFTINECLSFTVTTEPPGDSLEWIVEAPSSSSGVLPLADFHSVTLLNACWTTDYVPGAACLTIADAAALTAIDLEAEVFGREQVLAEPGPLDAAGQGFTVNYLQPTP